MQTWGVMTTTPDTLSVASDTATWYAPPVHEPAPRVRRDVRVLSALSDLIHSYPRPAYLSDERGEVVAMNAAAGRLLDESDETEGADALPEPSATLQIEGHTYRLFVVPSEVHEAAAGEVAEGNLPPRLARIARLVVSGCTDKQIAAKTGLSFSTVRTYVRQIYRRVGVHNRVELVHRTNAGTTLIR